MEKKLYKSKMKKTTIISGFSYDFFKFSSYLYTIRIFYNRKREEECVVTYPYMC